MKSKMWLFSIPILLCTTMMLFFFGSEPAKFEDVETPAGIEQPDENLGSQDVVVGPDGEIDAGEYNEVIDVIDDIDAPDSHVEEHIVIHDDYTLGLKTMSFDEAFNKFVKAFESMMKYIKEKSVIAYGIVLFVGLLVWLYSVSTKDGNAKKIVVFLVWATVIFLTIRFAKDILVFTIYWVKTQIG